MVCFVKLVWDVEFDVFDKVLNLFLEDIILFVFFEMKEFFWFIKFLVVFLKVFILYKLCLLFLYKILVDLIFRRLGFLIEFLVGKLFVCGWMFFRLKFFDSLILGFFMEVDCMCGCGDMCRVFIVIFVMVGLGIFLCLLMLEKFNLFIRIDFWMYYCFLVLICI